MPCLGEGFDGRKIKADTALDQSRSLSALREKGDIPLKKDFSGKSQAEIEGVLDRIPIRSLFPHRDFSKTSP